MKKLALKGEILSNDLNSANKFAEFLQEKIMTENLQLDNIYNADESGIYYKMLLKYTYALPTDKSAAGMKEDKHRFTALFCSNATGTHRIPLLIIGKSAKPRCFKNLIRGQTKLHDLNYLPKLDVSYSGQTSAWMNCEIFKRWYIFFISYKYWINRKTIAICNITCDILCWISVTYFNNSTIFIRYLIAIIIKLM